MLTRKRRDSVAEGWVKKNCSKNDWTECGNAESGYDA